ncbi:MAG: hypothetical protein IT236_17205 [Bacteroidia bacterium]|nr:hypothetical protein [Bacteroidia bacterium]
MDASKLTYKILGQKLLSWYDSKVLVDWALTLMQNGFDSDNLQILAGLDNSDTEEREHYFWRSVKDLNINIDKKEIDLIDFYVDNLVDEVLEGNVPPKFALRQMCEVARKTDYSPKYMDFYMLDDEIDSIEYDGHAIFTNGLTKNNADEYILNEFKLFKKVLNGNYSDYYDKAICNDCKQIMTPKLVTKYQFKNPFSFQAYVCEYCKSQNIDTFSSQTGKEKIINRLTET